MGLCISSSTMRAVCKTSDADELTALNAQAVTAYQKGNYVAAKVFYTQALSLAKKIDGHELWQAVLFSDLAVLETVVKEYDQAHLHFDESLKIKLKFLGPSDPSTIITMENLSRVSRKLKRDTEADQLDQRASELKQTTSTRRREIVSGGGKGSSGGSGNGGGAGSGGNTIQEGRGSSDTRARIEVRGVKTTIRQIVLMSSGDREYIEHPTIGERDVLDHYEHRTAYRRDSYGNSEPYEVQVPIYRHEKYVLSKNSDLEFVKALSDLGQRYQTSFGAAERIIKRGGAVIELENGMVIAILKTGATAGWGTGDDLTVQEHPNLELPAIVIVHGRTGKVVACEIIAKQ
jgi:tetratricopeptide (TPR) repeat protein